MSKLESAYLKALGPEHTDIEIGGFAGPDISQLVTSRRRIANMEQPYVFTEEQLAAKRIISQSMKNQSVLNIYRNLRTKLLSSSHDENFVTMVTSVVPQGGTSLTATNIAAAFAFDEGKTSLLIEANIQSPSLHKLLEVNDSSGLIDYLESEELTTDEILKPTGIPRLRFIPSGLKRENSAEYFTSYKMKAFINEILNRYPERFPIIDAPCIKNSADARILAELCARVILVVPYGKCTEEDIRYAVRAIGKEKLAGIILNQF